MTCPKCGIRISGSNKFCGGCGHRLDEPDPVPRNASEATRKHITVLFSDITDYTSLNEKLDPEEVREIIGAAFSEIAKIIAKYEGFIEKFVGDAVLGLFGVPAAHEDDPVRAIMAAREINGAVAAISSRYQKRIGKPLTMHTGISTGLVVTGEVKLDVGTHGVIGDTINTAARLAGLAGPGEIVVGADTWKKTERYFNFQPLEPAILKGKAEPVQSFKFLSLREDPSKSRVFSGRRAQLIGRKAEMFQLMEAVSRLSLRKGSVITLVGEAGTGKSRLVEEFKNKTGSDIAWREGHAYAYAQNIPYFLLVDLFNRAWGIKDGDTQAQVKRKVESGAGQTIGDRPDLIPYIGKLYSLSYPELDNLTPELWKDRLYEAVKLILLSLTSRQPTILIIEDLHWADPSSVELLRNIISDFRYNAMVVCVYRPSFNLSGGSFSGAEKFFQEIRLQELSPSDAQMLVESLLQTDHVPEELERFIREKVEGNPFYLEEVINSLLERNILTEEDGSWVLTKHLDKEDIPSTIQGVITARLDRLGVETRRIVQEASVIGRAFLYEILQRITELRNEMDQSLAGLERLDIIKTKTIQPDIEYIFKHALTQEVAYNGLLKKERRNIHEKIGQVMEELFSDRLPEFYESIAYHFRRGHTVLKAVDYLKKAGAKSHGRYSLDESHQYFTEAYEILEKLPQSDLKQEQIIELMLEWAPVFHHRADIYGLYELFNKHLELVENIRDDSQRGMFYVWLGAAMDRMEILRDSYVYLQKGLDCGLRSGDRKIISYAKAWLCYNCGAQGFLEEALGHAEDVKKMDIYFADRELFRLTNVALAIAFWFRGDVKKTRDTGALLFEHGKEHFDMRCISQGYMFQGLSRYIAGDFPSAVTLLKKALEKAIEPLFVSSTKLLLGMAYLGNGQLKEAEDVFEDVVRVGEAYKYGFAGTTAQSFTGIITVVRGDLGRGVAIVENTLNKWLSVNSRYRYSTLSYTLGRVYLQIAMGGGSEKKGLGFLVRNIGFLIKTLPFAVQKAEECITQSIKIADEIGANCIHGQALMDLGRLRAARDRKAEARDCFVKAASLFEQCGADVFLEQARQELASV